MGEVAWQGNSKTHKSSLTYQDLCKEESNNSINNDSQDSFCLEKLNKIGIGERKLYKNINSSDPKSETQSN
jgi:hypothetical protein